MKKRISKKDKIAHFSPHIWYDMVLYYYHLYKSHFSLKRKRFTKLSDPMIWGLCTVYALFNLVQYRIQIDLDSTTRDMWTLICFDILRTMDKDLVVDIR